MNARARVENPATSPGGFFLAGKNASAVNDRVRFASAEGIVVFAWVDLRARRDEDAGRPEREPR